ncbi:hypothetical protein GIB67_030541 [Kingdonia uniflora]|uniref:Peroxidase n=1 Tax=Kingdonia uniflora TaxID=39325 RepID=A0A7J7L4Z7_9MAGN|nr:hypothetical protein GIB67_030541 [Kingdonia uniflora]
MSSKRVLEVLLCVIVVVACLSVKSEAQLQVGFYDSRCADAESIVKQEVSKAFNDDKGFAAALLRMHFHDCFIRGCDGSVLIDSTSDNVAEKDSPANNPSLRGFDIIDNAKTRLESLCAGVVSCADILAFAARDSIVITGGIGYKVPAGRGDGSISLASDTANLAPPTFNLEQLTAVFAAKGFTQEEMIILSGSHTIGRSHCTAFSNRLYNFSLTTPQDPSLDPVYATALKKLCPPGNDPALVVPMDPSSPATLDAGGYYGAILKSRGLFTSDQTLNSTVDSANIVKQNNAYPQQWKSKFATAMVKMGKLDVITGAARDVRLNCRVVN